MAESVAQRGIGEDTRDRIISDPGLILEDPEVMRALIAANERAMGGNIVDLRGVAMRRLEARLDRLEDTHRSVIAAAYDNLAGTNMINRAVLRLLEPPGFEAFLADLSGPVAGALRVESIRLVLESAQPAPARPVDPVVHVAPPGFVDRMLTAGRNVPVRPIVLRQAVPGDDSLHGERAGDIRSEAMLRLDLGEGRLPGMLVLGAEDPHQFRPTQGTDLLGFFAGVFERIMRRWLA
ncbi:MAG: DUF484 family protein [Gemmobacter sp.]